jgi:hypothetical protein
MSSARLARRAATVSSGALALCLFSAGVAAADTGLPPLPTPDNVVTTIDQTVKQVTSTDPGTITQPGSTTPGSTTPGTTTPGSTTPGSKTPTTKTPTTAKKPVVSTAKKPTVRHAAPARKPAAPSSATITSYAAMMPAPMVGDLALPPATSVTSAAGQSPAVAPLLIPQVKQHISQTALAIEADKHTGPPIRAILLTLAIAAAVGVGYEHVRLVARGIRV